MQPLLYQQKIRLPFEIVKARFPMVATAFFLLFISSIISCSPQGTQEELYPFKESNLWGFKNKKDEMIIKPQYEAADRFSEGLSHVMLNFRHGYVNGKGEQVIPLAFYDATRFHDGLSSVRFENRLFGFINRAGEIAIQPSYYNARSFANGFAAVLIDGYWGFINTTGALVIDPIFKGADSFPTDDSKMLAPAKLEELWGYIDTQGIYTIKDQYSKAYPFSHHRAAVKVQSKFGFIDEQGVMILEPQWDDVGFFAENDVAPAKINDQWGYINGKGEWAITAHYHYAHSFETDLAMVEIFNKIGYINVQDTLVLKFMR